MSFPPSPPPGDTSPSRRPTVDGLMRAPVTTVETTAHLAAAAYLIKQASDTALVVISDDERRTPVSVITDSDIAQAIADGRDVEGTRISELHGRAIVDVPPDAAVADAAEVMLANGIHHLPVVADGRLLGMLEMADICRGLLDMTESREFPASG